MIQQTKKAEELCRGCKYIIPIIFCAPLEYGVEKECPCVDCLVKVMCWDKENCSERIHFLCCHTPLTGIAQASQIFTEKSK